MGRGHLLEYEQLANGYTNEEKNSPPPWLLLTRYLTVWQGSTNRKGLGIKKEVLVRVFKFME